VRVNDRWIELAGGVDRLNDRGPLFQRCRLTLGLSVGEVARASDVGSQEVRGWESRRQRIPARAWRVLLRFMDAAERRTMDRSLVSYYGTLEAKREARGDTRAPPGFRP
jgi:hypothetical protein